MNFEAMEQTTVALIVWNTERENDVHVYLGRLHSENERSVFINEEKGWRVSLNDEQLGRMRPVSEDLKETLLGAEYALSMTIGDLPESSREELIATGIKWHQ